MTRKLHARYNRVHTGLAKDSINDNPHGFNLEAIRYLDAWFQGEPWEIGLDSQDREKVEVKIFKKGQYADVVDVAAPQDIWFKIQIPKPFD